MWGVWDFVQRIIFPQLSGDDSMDDELLVRTQQ